MEVIPSLQLSGIYYWAHQTSQIYVAGKRSAGVMQKILVHDLYVHK